MKEEVLKLAYDCSNSLQEAASFLHPLSCTTPVLGNQSVATYYCTYMGMLASLGVCISPPFPLTHFSVSA